jgi:hypothetical protein
MRTRQIKKRTRQISESIRSTSTQMMWARLIRMQIRTLRLKATKKTTTKRERGKMLLQSIWIRIRIRKTMKWDLTILTNRKTLIRSNRTRIWLKRKIRSQASNLLRLFWQCLAFVLWRSNRDEQSTERVSTIKRHVWFLFANESKNVRVKIVQRIREYLRIALRWQFFSKTSVHHVIITSKMIDAAFVLNSKSIRRAIVNEFVNQRRSSCFQ